MAQARWWLWGLIPLALVWLLAILFQTRHVERDLRARSGAALASGAWVPGMIRVHGRDVTLGGEAYDAEAAATARATAEAVRGVRLVKDASRLIPNAKPYSWSATKADGVVTLAGHVPNPAARTAIFAAAGAGGAKVTDAATYAGGAPDGFAAAAAQLVAALGPLGSGTAALDGATATIKGTAPDAGARAAAEAALGKLPAGVTLGSKEISVPAYTFDATKEAATITLNGALPDTASREKILATARTMFAGAQLIDRTKLQTGAPAGFAGAVTTGLEQLSRLDSGALKITDTSVDLSGGALYGRAVDQIKGALGTLPSGFTAKADGVTAKPAPAPVDAATCQDRFNDLLSKGTVQFETGSATLDKVSAGILDHLVGIATGCPAQTLDISGHTDASGNEAFNMDLSKKRAQAVVDYLAAAGLDPTHLTATGYGKTKPIASNDTDEGRAKNRRIEFLVK